MKQFKKKNKFLNENLLQRGLRNDSCKYIIMVLLLAVAMYGMILLTTKDEGDEYEMDKNQIDIFTPDSQCGTDLLTNGAIPIGAVAIFDETKSYGEKIEILKRAVQQAESMPINYGLNVKSNSVCKISERELYVVEEKQYIDLKEKSAQKESNKNMTVECTYVTCTLRHGVTFKQFLNSTLIRDLMDGNYYIASSTIIVTGKPPVPLQTKAKEKRGTSCENSSFLFSVFQAGQHHC